MITLTIENSHLRRGLHGPHLSPESSNRRHIPCMGSRWKGEGERQYVDQVCTWPPCGTKSDTLLCFSFFFLFSIFFFSRVAVSNFVFSILNCQGNPWESTSLELIQTGHHAGERSLPLSLCTRYTGVLFFQLGAIPPIRNPCGLERGNSSSEPSGT